MAATQIDSVSAMANPNTMQIQCIVSNRYYAKKRLVKHILPSLKWPNNKWLSYMIELLAIKYQIKIHGVKFERHK